MSNKVIALESEIVRVEMKSNTLSKENSNLKNSIEGLNRQIENLKAELASVSKNYENIRQSYRKLVSSNEEMGLELVGLLSAKANFVIEKEKMMSDSEKLTKQY